MPGTIDVDASSKVTGYGHDISQPEKPEVTWYGWDGDRLVTAQTEQSRIQTIYEPGGFTPLVRVETGTEALATTRPQRSLAEKLRQEGNEDGTEMAFPAELVRHLDRLENELRRNAVSEESRKWLAQCGLTAEQMAGQLEEQTEPERTVHLYHCDHRGLPVALINSEGARDWSAEYDVWGNRLKEDNPQKLEQLIRLPGQQYDDETGLYYNRYRYYNPEQGRYISQDPIGLWGGWNLYTYPLNPVSGTDPLGLNAALLAAGLATMGTGAETGSGIGSVGGPPGAVVGAVVGAVSVGGVLLYNNREAVGDALDKGMTSLGEAEILKAESEMAFWNDPCGAFASVFGGDDSGNPNVGKDLTDEEKNELGGAGSGSPNGWGPEDEQDARHREQHERYKDELRQQMEKPTVEDAELKNIIDDLYRPNAKVGSGSTADAVRYELSTGEKVGGRGHIQKAEQYSESLQRWLNKNPSASPGDRAAAENVLRDLQRALRGE